MTNFTLEVKPAIEITHRHKLEDLLKELGYEVHSGGGYVDGSACDITFSTSEKEGDTNDTP